ncbi:MAG: MarR family winged helix-turn-helix transcriptional regulator [Ferrovibrionaceae bacterium]
MADEARRKLARDVLPELVGYHLRRAHGTVVNSFAAATAELDLSPGQFGMIALIRANPRLSQVELAAAIGLDKSTVAPAVDKLVRRKLIARKPSDADRRFNTLTLTTVGEALYQDALGRIRRHEDEITQALSADERQTLIGLLEKVHRT